jgi:hypothetical protein
MTNSRPIQTTFTGGEISPRMFLRVDTENYRAALRKAENVNLLPQGPVTRREGSRYVADVKTASSAVRLMPFIYSESVAYTLELGPLYVRYFTAQAQVVSGTPVEDVTTYAAGDLFNIHYAQKNDELLMAVNTHPLKVLTRTSATAFTFADFELDDGPYEPEIVDSTTAGATSGTTTLTATAAIFTATDTSGTGGTGVYDRRIRVYDGSDWFWAKITGFTSTTVVTVALQETLGGTAISKVRLGAFSTTSGFPAAITFFDNRLVLAGTTDRPTTLWLSAPDDYSDFGPGTGLDAEAIEITLASRYRSDIKFLQEGSEQLFIGTTGGMWRVFATGSVLTPSDRNARRIIGSGSSGVQPVSADTDLLFVHKDDRQISKVKFDLAENVYNAPPISLVAEHITEGGLTQGDYRESPEEEVYYVRGDGEMVVAAYLPTEGINGFSRHVPAGTSAEIESVAIIPVNSADDGKRDQVWISVKRTVNSAVVRHIEYYMSGLNTDSSVCYSGAATNGVIGGLTHLVGETVYVVGDGERLPDATVDGSGQVDLGTDDSWAEIEMGLAFSHKIWLLNPEFGHPAGATSGAIRRYSGASFYLVDSLSLKVNGTLYPLRVLANYDAAPDPVTQFAQVTLDHDPERDVIVKIEDDDPFDFTLAGVVFDQVVGDDR